MSICWVDQDEWAAKRHVVDDMDELIVVHLPGEWENEDGPLGWYAVSDSDGIFAYADNLQEAVKLTDHFIQTAIRETIEEHVARCYYD